MFERYMVKFVQNVNTVQKIAGRWYTDEFFNITQLLNFLQGADEGEREVVEVYQMKEGTWELIYHSILMV
jgi:hypothetical protein